MSKLDAALSIARQGLYVFPIKEGAKFPPLIKNWPERATVIHEVIIQGMWNVAPNANIGIHCAGLLVIDVDARKGGLDALELLKLTDELPDTLTSRTPGGGLHLFYRLPEDHPGVSNSVEQLGRGLDVRSTGGYVVAPGSTTAAGTYAWGNDTAIAAAPDWLVALAGAARPKSVVERTVEDAPSEAVDRAYGWLKTAERSVKGQGGDQAAYRVACGLRDMGLSYPQACCLMRSVAWDYGCGWRDGRLEEKPIRSAYTYATGDPGSRAAMPDDYPAPVAAVVEAKLPTSGTLILSRFASQKSHDAGYVIKGLLQRGSYAEVYGAPGEGKTFIALDMAYHVAAGAAWMDRRVTGGPVLYLAYEGTGGLVKRAQALRQRYGEKDVPFYICGAFFNMRDKAGRSELGAILAGMPGQCALIVVDTYARALCGGDENSAQDVGSFNQAINALIEHTGACVMIVHHSGKDKSKGARGSSALLGALDTEIEIDSGLVTARKQRDIEIIPPIGFKLTPLILGVDADGEEVTSCVVEGAAVEVARGLKRLKNGTNGRRGFDMLCELRPDNSPIHLEDWRDACKAFIVKDLPARFHDLKKQLQRDGYININEDGFVTRSMV